MSPKIEKILILLTDFITINSAFIFYFIIRVQTGWFDLIIMPEFFMPMLVVYIYWVVIFTFVGMYRTWFAASRLDELSTLFKASFVGIFILFFMIFIDDYIHNVRTSTRVLIFIYWGTFLLFVSIGRLFIRALQRRLLIKGIGRKNAVIVGTNSKAHEVETEIVNHKALGLDVVGYASLNNNIKIELEKNKEARILGSAHEIQHLIDQYNIKEVIIAVDKKEDDLLVEIISKCENKNVGLKIVPDLYEILSGQAKTSQIYGIPLIDIMPELMPEWEKKLKRLIDIVVSLIILIFNSPICLLAAIAIKMDSPGPIFFTQERCGMNNTQFRIVKFRSMFPNAEKFTGPVWSQKDDPRVTRIGRIIRKLRIDEIPQMFNVLKGEMSLVGPRPERPYFVEMLSKEIPFYKRRLKVRPGITGWAQVKHKYDETIEDVKIKLRYDLFYIENMSLRMDFKILFRTVFVVLFGKGHYN
ncbi:MAG TPA: sugar transferase [Ignavibacteriaceae bacterium]|nr:sugar transferase [Ignavibacteriaceae bacterium]